MLPVLRTSVEVVLVTWIVSDTEARASLICKACVSAMATPIVCVCVAKPCSSVTTVYSPGGRNGMMKSPFTDVTTLRAPCSAGDVTVTVTPGIGRPSGSMTAPRMTPVGLPWAHAPAATASTTITAMSVLIRMRSPS